MFPADLGLSPDKVLAITLYLCEVNAHASACVAACRKGISLPRAVPGCADIYGLDHVVAMEHALHTRRFWKRKTPQQQCEVGADRRQLVHRLSIAVDGSAGKDRDGESIGGSGFVVAQPGILSDRGELQLVEHCGPVITIRGEVGDIGATSPTNNTAEISALAATFRWLLSGAEVAQSVNILYDSTWAANITRRLWRPKTNREAASSVQRLLERVTEAGFVISWHHVKAHLGHYMNEAADVAAKRGSARS